MKKVLSFLISIIFCFSLVSFFTFNTGCKNKEFHANFRFVVTSDVHVRENGDFQSLERLNQFIDSAYEYSDSHEEYNNLDGMFFVGDNTQNGLQTEQELFFSTLKQKVRSETFVRAVMGNHEYYATGRYSQSSMQNAPLKFLEYSGYESTDCHVVLGGYHFILLSLDAYGSYSPGGSPNRFMSQEKLDWLKNELDVAVADDKSGDKPIFVFQHVSAENTILTSSNKDRNLKKLLVNYPNVVDFSGHSHLNLTDPQAFWQGEFTALSTGSLAYLGVNMPGHDDYSFVSQVTESGDYRRSYEQGLRNAGMYLICELDENYRLKVQIYDVITDSLWGDPIYFDNFGNPDKFTYKTKTAEQSDKPVFESSAILSSNNYKQLRLLIPQAICADPVATYRVDVWNSSRKNLRKQEFRLSGYHLGKAMPSYVEVYINGLQDDTSYAIDVYAINCYGKVSDPVSFDIHTSINDEESHTTPDILELSFLGNGTVKDENTSKLLENVGSPEVSSDLSTITFNGENAVKFYGIQDWYDVLSTGFSMETIVKVNEETGEEQALISNYFNGGMGLFYQNGSLKFRINCSGVEQIVSADLQLNEWAHVVCSYSNKTLSIFVNGVLAEELEIAGAWTRPIANSNYLVIGANSLKDGDITSHANCSFKMINLYTHSFGEEGALKVYERTLNND